MEALVKSAQLADTVIGKAIAVTDVKPRQRVRCAVPQCQEPTDYKVAYRHLLELVKRGDNNIAVCENCADSTDSLHRLWRNCHQCTAPLCDTCVMRTDAEQYDAETTRIWFYCARCATTIDMDEDPGVEPGYQVVQMQMHRF